MAREEAMRSLGVVVCAYVLASACDRRVEPRAREPAARVEAGPCAVVDGITEPYVLGMSPRERTALDTALERGIAVVRYDCNGVRVVEDCAVRESVATYAFVAVSPVQDRTTIANVDVSIVMVGRQSVRRDSVTRDDVTGPGCARATHFVRSSIVGAFALARRGAAKATDRAGDPSACAKVQPGDRVLPVDCDASITVELVPIVGGPAGR